MIEASNKLFDYSNGYILLNCGFTRKRPKEMAIP